MINKKNIITAAILAVTIAGSAASADNTNSLLQMDVKRSSVADTVDVTFYTTGDMSNSVVTRKANDRYVVLLPNVSSSASVAPGFGGVKDLITDINVKHVDDGIGGYTKVTFNTTKPVNIKTHMKKTQPLTQAQKDYKAILAQNNQSKAKTNTSGQSVKQVSNTAKYPAAAASAKTAPKTVQKNNSAAPAAQKTVSKPSTAQNSQTAAKKTTVQPAKKADNKIKNVNEKSTPQKTITAAAPNIKQPVEDTYVPKMKFDENGKRILDLEPRVSHKIVSETPALLPQTGLSANTKQTTGQYSQSQNTNTKATAAETPAKTSQSGFPFWILAAGGSVLALGILYLIFDAVKNSSNKDKTRLQSFFNMSAQNTLKRRKKEYEDIVNNKELNWQEKYKLYTEKEAKRKTDKEQSDMSYVTDLAGTKQALVEPQNTNNDFKNKFNEKMQAKISQLEHTLAQTPSVTEPEFEPDIVKSEDNMIISKISDVKLKSFSKPISLKQTVRTMAEPAKKISENKTYKESRFVKLKNSPLSVSRRNSASNKLGVNRFNESENIYLTNNNGEMKMSNEKENYLLSSLNEYLSILDEETERKSTPAGSLAQLRTSSENELRQSQNVTNPVSKASNPAKQPGTAAPYMNGLIVKSGYNIDSEKGFYVVNIDGVSALVGRIKDSVFILKKFDHVIDKPIQVRQDDGSVYIVRVGKYKCLVDVSKDKMGTLIEI